MHNFNSKDFLVNKKQKKNLPSTGPSVSIAWLTLPSFVQKILRLTTSVLKAVLVKDNYKKIIIVIIKYINL